MTAQQVQGWQDAGAEPRGARPGANHKTSRPVVFNLILSPIVVNRGGDRDQQAAISDFSPIVRVVADEMRRVGAHQTSLTLSGVPVAFLDRDIAAWWVTELPKNGV
ncbi:MAG: hypothetical protein OXT51_08785 [Chloroflexota bacterium]|nr:hypothetical protein [Chloroflexota bacterium]MDE2970182.1 hypothetical protein [Chloroflexota bacterium]